MSQLPKSLFVSDEIQSREVELPDGSKYVLNFKQVPAIEFNKYFHAEKSADPEVQGSSMARLIAASLCDPDGKPAVTFKDALKLNAHATNALFIAVLSVNGMAKKDGAQTPGEG